MSHLERSLALGLEAPPTHRLLAEAYRRMGDPTGAERHLRRAAELEAARVPLETAEACLEALKLASQVARLGNVNAVSDAGVAGLLAEAGGRGALLNVQINLKSLPDGADKSGVRKGFERLEAELGREARRCQESVQAVLDA